MQLQLQLQLKLAQSAGVKSLAEAAVAVPRRISMSRSLFIVAEAANARLVAFCHEAAADGDAESQLQLGMYHEQGLYGEAQSDAQAAHWFRLSALQGNADAQCRLGTLCEAGSGVATDPQEAAQWYQEAATQGHALAQCNLAVL